RNPRLCGVHWYSGPGLPRPTMSRIFLSPQGLQVQLLFLRVRKKPLNPETRLRTKPALLLLLLLLARSFGALFAFHFLLALLADCGLGRRAAFPSDLGRLLFFGLESNDVSNHALRFGNELHLVGINLDVAGAQRQADHQAADVEAELGRNFAGQAFDFNFAG